MNNKNAKNKTKQNKTKQNKTKTKTMETVFNNTLRGDTCMLLAHRPYCTVTLNSN